MMFGKIIKTNSVLFSGAFKGAEGPSLTRCLYSFLWQIFHSFRHPDFHYPKINHIIFYSTGKGHDAVLKPIWELQDKNEYVVWHDMNIFGLTLVNIYTFFTLPLFLLFYFSLNKENKNICRYFFYNCVRTYAYSLLLNSLLKANKDNINVVILANDHTTTNRCLIEAARKNRIKTIYTQHASVSEMFPRLITSYSFLDGLDAYNKYFLAGKIEGDVILSGASRFDRPKKMTANKRVCKGTQMVGIALSDNYPNPIIYDLCDFLSKKGCRIIIRPRPSAPPPAYYIDNLRKLGIQIDDADNTDSFEFLSNLKLLIAGDSSIHLDAAMLRVPSVYYNFGLYSLCESNKKLDVKKDYYSFVRNKLIKSCNTFEAVLECVKASPPIDTNAVRLYDASFGTQYEGNVSEVIAKFISLLNQKKDVQDYLETIFYKNESYYSYKKSVDAL